MFHSDVWRLSSSTLTYHEEMTINLIELTVMGIKFRSDEARIPRALRTRNFGVSQVLLRTCLEG